MTSPWLDDDDDEDDESWRGDIHQEEWPEDLAGPEYWFWRKWLEGGEGQ